MRSPAISILIPTYNQSGLLRQCLHSVLRQGFTDYEIIVADDCSPDDTASVVKSLDDERIRYVRNATNVGYGGNLAAGGGVARGEVLFLLGHDDILLAGALQRVYDAFAGDESVGIVTRPYYWFFDDPAKPVRAVKPYDSAHDATLSLRDGRRAIEALFRSAGQLSGLAYRRSFWRVGFHHHIFTAHVYPFADILKRSDAVYLKDYTVAVRIGSSMTRHRPSIYVPSPIATWVEMFDTVYTGSDFRTVRNDAIDFITSTTFEGLVQLRNYANIEILLGEVRTLVMYRRRNLLHPRFWFYYLITLLTPSSLLIRINDAYKRRLLSRALNGSVMTIGVGNVS